MLVRVSCVLICVRVCAHFSTSHTGYCALDQSYKPLWARHTLARLLQSRAAVILLILYAAIREKKKKLRGGVSFIFLHNRGSQNPHCSAEEARMGVCGQDRGDSRGEGTVAYSVIDSPLRLSS